MNILARVLGMVPLLIASVLQLLDPEVGWKVEKEGPAGVGAGRIGRSWDSSFLLMGTEVFQ